MNDIEKIVDRLKQITPQWETIMTVLGPETFLSGGLVLQSMLDENWATDIDIFTTNYNLKSLGNDWNCIPHSKGYEIIPGVIAVYTGKLGDAKIDIIHITDREKLFEGYDFEFCKVWFDGKKCYAHNIESVKTKTCTVEKDTWQLRNPGTRIPKYIQRGFTIIERHKK